MAITPTSARQSAAKPSSVPAKPRGKNVTPPQPRYHGKDKRTMKRFIHQLETLKGGRKLTREERASAIAIQSTEIGRTSR